MNPAAPPLIPPLSSCADLAPFNRAAAAAPLHVLAAHIADLATSTRVIQSSALGPSGLVIAHALAAAATKDAADAAPVPIVFIDTLYHFSQTYALLDSIKATSTVHSFQPQHASTQQEFESRYGQSLWSSNPDKYDFLVKAEPGRRAFESLKAAVVVTGRRRSQGGQRSDIQIYEYDTSFSPPILKINPLAHWYIDDVWAYIRQHRIRYNPLHDEGYASIGDVHSTVPVTNGQSERDGRWVGSEKTECGLHSDYFKLRAAALEKHQQEDSGNSATTIVASAAEHRHGP